MLADNSHSASTSLFDLATKAWRSGPTLPGGKGKGNHTACTVDGNVVVFGGSSGFNDELQQCLTFHNDVAVGGNPTVPSAKRKPDADPVVRDGKRTAEPTAAAAV